MPHSEEEMREIAYSKNLARIPLFQADGLADDLPASGLAVGPLDEQQAARLRQLFMFGDAVTNLGAFWSSRFTDNVTEIVRYKVYEMIQVGKLIGGTLLMGAECPSVQAISVTDARVLQLELAELVDFCLPAIPPGETENQTMQRVAREDKETWLLVYLALSQIEDAIEDLIDPDSPDLSIDLLATIMSMLVQILSRNVEGIDLADIKELVDSIKEALGDNILEEIEDTGSS